MITTGRLIQRAVFSDIEVGATVTTRFITVTAAAYMALLAGFVSEAFVTIKAILKAFDDDSMTPDFFAYGGWIFTQSISYSFK